MMRFPKIRMILPVGRTIPAFQEDNAINHLVSPESRVSDDKCEIPRRSYAWFDFKEMRLRCLRRNDQR